MELDCIIEFAMMKINKNIGLKKLKFQNTILRFIFIFLFSTFSVTAFGQTDLVNWNDISPTTVAGNISATNINPGGGVTVANAGFSGFRINNLHNGTNNTINYNKYLEFSITPDTNYKILLSQFKIQYNSPNDGSGPTKLQVRYSIDPSFPSNGTLLGTEQTLTLNSEQNLSLNFPANYKIFQTLYLRVYAFGQTNLFYSDFYLRNSLYNANNQGPTITGTVTSSIPPVATNDNATAAKNTPLNINILGNDVYTNLSAITITQQPANGQNITVNGLTNVTYTPNNNYTGTDFFKYKITDENGISNEATVNIDVVDPVAPTAVADNALVIKNVAKNINVLANDNPGSGTFNTVTIVTNPSNGNAIVNPDKTITYTPTNNYTGPDNIQYNVTNNQNLTSNTVSVTINVTDSGNLVTWNGANTDFTPNLLVSNITASNITSSGGITLTNQGQFNQFFQTNSNWPSGALDETKYVQFTITPDANYKIALDQFNFVAQMNGGTADYEIRYSKNFTNGYTISSNGNLNNSFVSKSASLSGMNPVLSGETVYIRLYIYNTFNSLRIQHSWGGSTGPTITGIVYTDTPPVTTNDNATTTLNTPVTIDILGNDTFSLLNTITITQQTTHGQIVVNGLSNITYTPNNNYSGVDFFKYNITDKNGISNEASVNISVINSTGLVRWNNANFTPSLIASNITSSNLIAAGGVTLSANTSGNSAFFQTDSWPTPNQNSGGIDISKYVEFTISPNAGYQINLDKFNFYYSAQGTQNFQVRYSKDNFATYYTSIGNTVIPNTNWISASANISSANPVLPGQTVKIRIYAYNTYNRFHIRRLLNTAIPTDYSQTPTITGDVSLAICYNPAVIIGTSIPTKMGITLLQRAGGDNTKWPMVRNGGVIALESNTKGFVITRMTTAQISAIASPQEAMMVYDTTAQCLKLYNGTAWSCFNTATCP